MGGDVSVVAFGELPPREGEPVAPDERVDGRSSAADYYLGADLVGGAGQALRRDQQCSDTPLLLSMPLTCGQQYTREA